MSDTAAVPLHPTHRLFVFGILMLSLFMAMLDNQIVSTALPTIVGDFGDIARFGWIGSAYLLAQAAVMPVYGKLGDLFGRKYVLMAALTLFVLGSLTCGLAYSMNSLIAARVLQGLGGGGIMVTVFAVNADIFPPRERAKYQSFTSLVLMAASAIGPALGGVLSEAFGWRAIFLVNLPIGIVALAGLQILLPRLASHRKPVIDFAGAVSLAAGIACVVLWADSGQLFGSVLSGPSLVLLALAVVILAIWWRIEQRAAEPIIPPYLFSRPNFGLLLLAGLASGGMSIGLLNYHALYLQMTTGLNPSRAGLFLLAITGGMVAGSVTAGRIISATGRYKMVLQMAFGGSALALFGLSQLPVGLAWWALALALMAQGLCVGLGQQAPIIGVQTAVPQADLGAATGAVTLSRITGASLAISIYGALLGWQVGRLAVPGAGDLTSLGPDRLALLPEPVKTAVEVAFGHVYGTIYLAAAAIALAGFAAALGLRRAVIDPARAARAAHAPKGAAAPAE